jgi:hypothetical protein
MPEMYVRTSPERQQPRVAFELPAIAVEPGGAVPPESGADGGDAAADRLRRRARLLHELNEAKRLRERVHPRRSRNGRLRQAMRMRTFRG